MIDFKKLIDDATKEDSLYASEITRERNLFKQGAAFTSELLLNALETMQDEIDCGYDPCGHLANSVIGIRQALKGER